MALNARTIKNEGTRKTYPVMEPGSYPVRLVQVIDLGVQKQEYAGEAKAPRQQLMLTYEFLDEFLPDDDGNPDLKKPRWLSEDFPLYNLDAENAKSTGRYYALDPEEKAGGDFTSLVGFPATALVIQKKSKDRIFNNISGLAAMRPKDAEKAPELVNPPKIFVMDNPDMTIFNSLPQFITDKIKGALNYSGSPLEAALKGTGGSTSQKGSTAAGKAPKGSVEDVEDNIPFDPDQSAVDPEDDAAW